MQVVNVQKTIRIFTWEPYKRLNFKNQNKKVKFVKISKKGKQSLISQKIKGQIFLRITYSQAIIKGQIFQE